MSVIATKISRRNDNEWLLNEVSFTAETGTVFGIAGPHGSGKSTLLHVLAGKATPNGGTIEVGGDRSGGDRPHLVEADKKKGWLGNLAGGAGDGRISPLRLVEDAVNGPSDVLLFDDTLAHCDLVQRTHAFDQLRRAAADGRTVIYASPNFEDLFMLCDRVLLLHEGKAIQEGTPHDVYLEPVSRVAASITGRVNVIEARRMTSSKSDTPEFQMINGSHRVLVKKTERSRLGPLNQNVHLTIRPEHVSIAFGASFPEDNLLKATITKVTFLGANTLVECDASGLTICAMVLRLVGLSPGDECVLGLPPHRILVMAD